MNHTVSTSVNAGGREQSDQRPESCPLARISFNMLGILTYASAVHAAFVFLIIVVSTDLTGAVQRSTGYSPWGETVRRPQSCSATQAAKPEGRRGTTALDITMLCAGGF
jgi:hypothetical protein